MADLLVRGRDVITMDANRRIVRDGAVAVTGTTITAVGPFSELRAAHPLADVLGDAGDVVTPGYVNAHQHLTGDRLVRSCIPDTIASDESIFGWAVPIHAAHTADDEELSAILSLVEALGNGVTTTIEAGTVAHPDRVVRALLSTGARGTVGRWGWDVEGLPHAAPAAEVLARAEALIDATAGATAPAGAGSRGPGPVHAWVTLVGHDLMSDDLVVGASELARRRHTGLTFHMSPHDRDATAFLARTGRRPLVHLEALGVLGPHVLLAHAVHLDDAEVDAVLRTGTSVAACPWAYLRLAQGVTGAGRHLDLLRRGGRVALGCDAENASDAIDVLRQAALFVGLGRDATRDPRVLDAHRGLALATIEGAEAVGMADHIGSLEAGKQADIVVHDTRGPQWTPRSPDPVLQLIWASDGRSVRDVVVAGRVVVRDRRCVTVDLDSLREAAQRRSLALLQAAGKA